MSIESEMTRLGLAKQNFEIALEYHGADVEEGTLFSEYPYILNTIPFMLSPETVDYNHGYIDTSGWHYDNSNGKNPIDIYRVDKDHTYLVVLGNTVGNRFRVCVVDEDIRTKTSGVYLSQFLSSENTPKTIYYAMGNYTNPNYSRKTPFFTAAVDGWLLIQKDTNYTTGLKSYVVDLATPIDVLNGASGENLLDESLFDVVNGIITLKAEVDKSEITGRKFVPDTVDGQTVVGLGDNCFANCTALAAIELPSTCTSIGSNCFLNNAIINVNTLTSSITTLGDYVFKGNAGIREATIPSSVTSMGVGIFEDCTLVPSVRIDAHVTTLNGTFKGCTNLTDVNLSSTITTLGLNAFKNTKLASVPNNRMPNVTSFGESAFSDRKSMTTATIPSRITSIGVTCFRGCTKLTWITLEGTTPPTLGENAFTNTNNCPIYVPDAVVDTYKAAPGWSTYADRITGVSNKT